MGGVFKGVFDRKSPSKILKELGEIDKNWTDERDKKFERISFTLIF